MTTCRTRALLYKSSCEVLWELNHMAMWNLNVTTVSLYKYKKENI